MPGLTDPFGAALQTEYDGGTAYEIVERDDGHIDANPVALYFRPYDEWSPLEQEAMSSVRGRVLDVGCGAGRHSLYLQQQGHPVVGLDVSPGALAVAEARGLAKPVQMDIADLDADDGESFETVCMLGGNFGLVGTRERASRVFAAIDAATTPTARVLAESVDPYETDDTAHLAYHRLNEERDRLPGALRIRIRYKLGTTDWFDYLFASPSEMRSIARENGWDVVDTIERERGPAYVGVLEKRREG